MNHNISAFIDLGGNNLYPMYSIMIFKIPQSEFLGNHPPSIS